MAKHFPVLYMTGKDSSIAATFPSNVRVLTGPYSFNVYPKCLASFGDPRM
eukprot:11452.XXX_357606_357755_1 [CDS] Oithona nana genome sequencing.